MKATGCTHVGYHRKNNEDAFLVDPSQGVFAVADGMGGHLAGEIASQAAIGYLRNQINLREMDASVIFDAINQLILRLSQDNENCRGMGTTLTLARIRKDSLEVAHTGDSRAYLIRGQHISQLTTDHTMVNELLKVEEITPEEAAEHPYKHVLSRALGVEDKVEADKTILLLEEGDRILLSTDGLHGLLPDEEILGLAITHTELDTLAEILLQRALENGGNDNITLVVIHYTGENGEQA